MEHVEEPGRPVGPPQDPILADDQVLDYERDRIPRVRRYAECQHYQDGTMGRFVLHPATPQKIGGLCCFFKVSFMKCI